MAESRDAPPDCKQIDKVYKSNPDAVCKMVQKLWVLEHATPVVGLPEQRFIWRNDGSLVVDYVGFGVISLGEDANQMAYRFRLDPSVHVGVAAPEWRVPWWVYVAAGVLTFAVGTGTGIYISNALHH